jgi:type VI secretion system protein ImpE
MAQSTSGAAAPSEAGRLFREGKLADAVAAANVAVRKTPTDIGARVLLAELLLFAGNVDRVDVVLDACTDLDPTAVLMVAEFRQLLRGEIARRQLFSEGRLPEFLGEPSEAQRLALAALVALRGGDVAAAGKLSGQAEEARIHPSGSAAEGPFDDMRDADDLLAACFEVITTTGKYFWISPERVATLECQPMKRPRDLFWRRATMHVSGGPEGEVYLPTIYPPVQGAAEPGDALRLGRATDWMQVGDNGPTRGVGAVTLIVGEEPKTWLEMGSLTFQPAVQPAA